MKTILDNKPFFPEDIQPLLTDAPEGDVSPGDVGLEELFSATERVVNWTYQEILTLSRREGYREFWQRHLRNVRTFPL